MTRHVFSKRRISRMARFLRKIEDPSDYASALYRFLHRRRFKLESVLPHHELVEDIRAYQEAIEDEVQRQEGARDHVIAQAAQILLHGEGDENALQKLAFDRIPDLSYAELGMAWAEMRRLKAEADARPSDTGTALQ